MRMLFLAFLLLSSAAYSQNGLQGPFVPIGIEQVHTNGNTADVLMLYRATTTAGQDIYATSTHTMDEAAIVQQTIKKNGDPNGQQFMQRLRDDGWNYDEVGGADGAGGFNKDTLPDDPEYDSITGTCAASGAGFTLVECIAFRVSALNGDIYTFTSIVCTAAGVDILFEYEINGGGVVSGGVWTPIAGLSACQDKPPGTEIPKPQDPKPAPEEFSDYMKGDPDYEPNPQAPNPRPPQYPPPLADPDFYRSSGSRQFDMQLPSIPTPQESADQMTSDYADYTQTSAPLAAPLPSGMSFEPAPPGGSGEYGSPLSSYGSVGGASVGSGGGSGGEGGDTNITVNVPDICETNPNSLACVNTNVGDEVVPDITVPELDAGVGFSPIALSSATGCPAPITVDFMGSTFDIEYTIICNYGASVGVLFQLFASLSAAMIMLGIRSTG